MLRLCFHVFTDLFRCPFQWAVNFVFRKGTKKENLVHLNFDGSMLDDVCVVLHHYAPRGLSFFKSAGGRKYLVGIGIVLEQLKDTKLSVNCFVAEATDDYLLELKRNFKEVNFIPSKGKKYDFFSYIQASSLIDSFNCKYYCMFNDNIDHQSNVIEFMKSAKRSVNNSRLGMIGVGSNTFLTQSFFKRSFSPHIQSYGFFIKKNIFDKFASDFNWFLSSLEFQFLLKSSLCRLLEQGLSKYVLKRNHGLGFIQKQQLTTYRRRLKYLDLKKDWNNITGDYRNNCSSPFLFLGLNDSPESKIIK